MLVTTLLDAKLSIQPRSLLNSTLSAGEYFYKVRGSPLEIFRELVLIRVHSAHPVTSPAYDLGLSEDEVAARWLKRMGLARLHLTPMAAALQATTHDDSLETLKAELERFGEANDATTNERPRRMLNITRDTGEFLGVLVRATGAQRVLEIGTSNGYSTLWLADAVRAIGGSVTTIDFDVYKVGLATANFARAHCRRSSTWCKTTQRSSWSEAIRVRMT
jgi:hypothetical protein